jgi:hypothetical protein
MGYHGSEKEDRVGFEEEPLRALSWGHQEARKGVGAEAGHGLTFQNCPFKSQEGKREGALPLCPCSCPLSLTPSLLPPGFPKCK